jgi:hypothetical protein
VFKTNFPSKSLIAPELVPTTLMLAPGIGCFLLSETVPEKKQGQKK